MTWPEAFHGLAVAFGVVGCAWAVAYVIVKKDWNMW